MPKVSIIMPTYNRSWIIERAVNSVLQQTMSDFELIIIDDGSTDDTVKKVKNIEDKRIVMHSLSENKGQVVARNEGLKIAQGEIIAYLDSDNVWYKNYLEVMLAELTPYYILVYSAQNVFLCSGSKENLHVIGRQVRDYLYNPDGLTRGNSIDINCTIHRKSILDEVGMFDENLKTLEDWDIFARIAVKHPFQIKHVSQVLGEYYFFLRDTASTVENGILSDDWLREHFNLHQPTGDDKVVIDKIKKLIGNNQ